MRVPDKGTSCPFNDVSRTLENLFSIGFPNVMRFLFTYILAINFATYCQDVSSCSMGPIMWWLLHRSES